MFCIAEVSGAPGHNRAIVEQQVFSPKLGRAA
jgi:hypothetical protein